MNVHRPNYQAWLIDETAFPVADPIENKIAFLLGYGVLAPSQHNTQPWRFNVQQNVLRISADYTKSLPVGDPHNNGLFIGLGACAENIIQAGAHFGLQTTVRFTDDVAELAFEQTDERSVSIERIGAITHRHSDKVLYDGQPLSQSELDALVTEGLPGVECAVLSQPDQLKSIVALHKQATDLVTDDPAFVRELVGWLRLNNTKAYDGMPGFVSGISSLKAFVGKMVLAKKPQLFKKMAAHDVELMASASAVAVWATNDMSTSSLFACGRHAERLWLQATEKGLAVHPMHSMCADEQSRAQLASLATMSGTPVLVARVGHHADAGLRTPRRRSSWN